MGFSKKTKELASIAFKILEETIKKRALLENEWENQTDRSFEDGQRVKIKTDINFSSANGFSLLDFSIISGDIEKAKELIEKGARSDKALLLSLALESKELTSIIFAKNMTFDYSDLNCSSVPDPSFSISPKMLEHLKELMRDETTETIKIVEIDNKGHNPLHHAAFLIFTSFKKASSTLTDEQLNSWINAIDNSGYTPLYYACLVGNVEYIDYLVKKGANIEEDFIYRENKTHRTPLFISTMAGRLESVQKLIELGAKVKSDIAGKSPLSVSIPKNNQALIKLLLEHGGAELVAQLDYNQRNVIHVLAKEGNKETCQYLCSLPELLTKNLLDQRDVFGKTPLDIAYSENNIDFISAYSTYYELTERCQENMQIDLKQSSLNANLRYYLNLTNQNADIIDPIGTCNGLAVIKSIYSNRAYLTMLENIKKSENVNLALNVLLSEYYESEDSKKNDFYKIKNLLANWNGSYEDLERPITIQLHDYPENVTLKELFREWSEHIAWFQQAKLSNDFKTLNTSQQDRVNQIRYLGIKSFSTENDVRGNGATLIEPDQLAEMLALLSTKPGTKLYLGGGQHVVSIFCPIPGKLDLYDPNLEDKLPLYSDFYKLSKDILNIKYMSLAKHEVEEGNVKIRVQWSELKSDGWPENIPTNKTLPNSQQEIEAFIKNSPNHFNQLHTAIIENNVSLAKDLLNNNKLDFEQKDLFFNKTPKELCFHLKRKELIGLYICKDKNGDKLMNQNIVNCNYDMVDILLESGVELNAKEILKQGASNFGSIDIDILIKYNEHLKADLWVYGDKGESSPLLNLVNSISEPDVHDFIQSLIKKHPDLRNDIEISPDTILNHIKNQNWNAIKNLLSIKNDFVNGKVSNTPLICYLVNFANDNDENAKSLILSFINHGVDLNAQAPSGKTPLHLAAYTNPPKTEIIMLLLKHGAHKSLEITDNEDKTCFDILKSKQPECKRVLQVIEQLHSTRLSPEKMKE